VDFFLSPFLNLFFLHPLRFISITKAFGPVAVWHILLLGVRGTKVVYCTPDCTTRPRTLEVVGRYPSQTTIHLRAESKTF